MRREFRCKTLKESRKGSEVSGNSRSKVKENEENMPSYPAYPKLSYMDIQQITRSCEDIQVRC